MIKIPPKKNLSEIKKFFKKKKLDYLLKNYDDNFKKKVNNMIVDKPYLPELKDLYMLYQYVVLNKRTTILEFGSGWSSLIFSFALTELKLKYQNKIKNLRRNNPFELFILENEKKYLNITKKRNNFLQNKDKNKVKIHYKFSEVEMTLFKGRICTEFRNLPTCSPDFIYLDGPDQFNVKKKVNGITTAHKDMMPMSCDLLKIEYFLTPGTIIICDGRTANASLLKDNFKRKWIYKRDLRNDQHIFYLNDNSLGVYNQKQLNFYKS